MRAAAVKWALNGGPDLDITLHLRMLHSKSQPGPGRRVRVHQPHTVTNLSQASNEVRRAIRSRRSGIELQTLSHDAPLFFGSRLKLQSGWGFSWRTFGKGGDERVSEAVFCVLCVQDA